jgi:LysR family transcriptional regulator, transcriptional activator for dmlA
MNDATRSKESIDLQLIELFVTIARSKTIAAAARQFNVSPSLATRRLASLERALQVRLFQRTTRALHLTDAGRDALEWAEQVLHSHASLIDDLSRRDQMPEGLIRLAVSDYVASMLLPDFLHGFMKRYPKVRYLIKTTDHLINPVDHAFDVAVHSGFMPDSSLIGIPVRPVQRILCASPEYMKQAGVINSPADLLHHVCLAHEATEQTEWFFERDGTITGQEINRQLSVDSFVALLQFALKGVGIVRISHNVVRHHLKAGDLVQILPAHRCVQPNGELPSIWVIYPNRKLPYRVRTFVTELQRFLGQAS